MTNTAVVTDRNMSIFKFVVLKNKKGQTRVRGVKIQTMNIIKSTMMSTESVFTKTSLSRTKALTQDILNIKEMVKIRIYIYILILVSSETKTVIKSY